MIGCTGDLKRVGYAWLEFERLGEPGTAQQLTVGVGMRYAKDQADVTRWYFVARNRSVGSDLSLLRGRDPISKGRARRHARRRREVLDTGRDYRSRLNDLMFGFGGEEQYQTMLRLMRDLRRPHLSKTLDPERVAAQLTIGLPEVDEALMRKLAGGLEQLETLERGLARLRDVRERVRRFHQRTYSAYARATVRERADTLRQANTAVEGAAERLRAAAAELAPRNASGLSGRADSETRPEARLDALSAEEHALVTSAAWSSVAEVETLRELAQTQARAATAARRHADDAAAEAGALEAELITARAAAVEGRNRASDELDSLLALAAAAGLERRAAILAQQLRTGSLAADTWSPLLRELATDWRDVLHRHRELMRELRQAAGEAERARAGEREAAARLEQAAARRTACEQQLEEARAALGTAFERWRSALEQLELNEPAAAAALELAHDGSSPLPALAPSVDRRRASLSDARSAHTAAREVAATAVAATEEEIDRLAGAHDEGPRPPEWLRADRAERAGAPLWRLIDFRAEVRADERSSLEAGLEAAGLLDAWVMPSGGVEAPALADVVFASAPPAEGRSLLDVLEPVPDEPVAVDVVARLLSCLGLGEHEKGPWVGVDGSFALGPLRGRGAKDRAGHIGAAARESRRAARIAQLRERIAALENEIADHDARIADVDRRRQALEAELHALPPVDAVASRARRRPRLERARIGGRARLRACRGRGSVGGGRRAGRGRGTARACRRPWALPRARRTGRRRLARCHRPAHRRLRRGGARLDDRRARGAGGGCSLRAAVESPADRF